MEKTLRVLGGEAEGHSHSHSHSPVTSNEANASGVSVSPAANGLKSRKQGKQDSDGSSHPEDEVEQNSGAQSSKLSAYLNLFGDFVHNMSVSQLLFMFRIADGVYCSTDGLAYVSSSFQGAFSAAVDLEIFVF